MSKSVLEMLYADLPEWERDQLMTHMPVVQPRVIIIAGYWRHAELWCKENGLNHRDRTRVSVVLSHEKLMGVMPDDVARLVVVGAPADTAVFRATREYMALVQALQEQGKEVTLPWSQD